MQTGISGHTGCYSDAKQSPGNKNALTSPKTIHSGAFMVGMEKLVAGKILEAVLGSFGGKHSSDHRFFATKRNMQKTEQADQKTTPKAASLPRSM